LSRQVAVLIVKLEVDGGGASPAGIDQRDARPVVDRADQADRHVVQIDFALGGRGGQQRQAGQEEAVLSIAEGDGSNHPLIALDHDRSAHTIRGGQRIGQTEQGVPHHAELGAGIEGAGDGSDDLAARVIDQVEGEVGNLGGGVDHIDFREVADPVVAGGEMGVVQNVGRRVRRRLGVEAGQGVGVAEALEAEHLAGGQGEVEVAVQGVRGKGALVHAVRRDVDGNGLDGIAEIVFHQQVAGGGRRAGIDRVQVGVAGGVLAQDREDHPGGDLVTHLGAVHLGDVRALKMADQEEAAQVMLIGGHFDPAVFDVQRAGAAEEVVTHADVLLKRSQGVVAHVGIGHAGLGDELAGGIVSPEVQVFRGDALVDHGDAHEVGVAGDENWIVDAVGGAPGRDGDQGGLIVVRNLIRPAVGGGVCRCQRSLMDRSGGVDIELHPPPLGTRLEGQGGHVDDAGRRARGRLRVHHGDESAGVGTGQIGENQVAGREGAAGARLDRNQSQP